MVTCTIMRIDEGIWWRSSDTKKLHTAATRVRPIHMTNVGPILVVTASAEQMPSTCTMIGLLVISGPTNTCFQDASAIALRLPRFQIFQKFAVALLTEPEMQHGIYPFGGYRRTGQAVHLVLRMGAGGVDPALHHANCQVFTVEYFL